MPEYENQIAMVSMQVLIRQIFKWNTVLVFSVLFVFPACYAQNKIHGGHSSLNDQPSTSIAIGDSVTEMNDSIMVVFQDKNNNYWFGSNGAGVYRYDGKTILHFTMDDGLCGNRIWKIEEDQSGNLYFPSQQGCISKFDGERFITLSITSNSSTEWVLEPDDVWFRGAQDEERW